MADDHAVFLHEGESEDAGHATPVFVFASEIVDSIVRGGDGGRYGLLRISSGGSEFVADYFDGGFGGFFTGGVTAESVDDEEDSERVVNEAAVLVFAADQAGVGARGGSPFVSCGHGSDGDWMFAVALPCGRGSVTRQGLASKWSVSTSAMPMVAGLGSFSSWPRVRRFPLSQVPFMLLSTMRNPPRAGSRRTRRCSRETSSLV